MKCHYNLDISTKNCFVDGFDVYEFAASEEGCSHVIPDPAVRCFCMIPIRRVFKTEWINYVQSKIPDPLFEQITIFERLAGVRHYNAHVDYQHSNGINHLVPLGLNFSSIENDPTDMMWYEDPQEDIVEFVKPYKNELDRDILTEIDRGKIPHDRLCLIRSDIIHDIDVVPVDVNRYAFSLRVKTPRTDWNETVSLYEHLFV